MVPEFSIGGEAIYQRRAVISKINNGTIDKVNWLHPHSKSGKRFERALTGMEKSSRGYFVWEGYSLSVFGRKYSNEKVVGMYHHPQVVDRFERYLYVLGQVATAIKSDGVRASVDGDERFIPCDTVINALGMTPRWDEADALRFCAPEFYQIGDCLRARNLMATTSEAWTIARNIGC